MANKPLQSIKFPGLSDTYTTPQVDATLTTTGAAADAKKTGDEITSIKEDLSDVIIKKTMSVLPFEKGSVDNNGINGATIVNYRLRSVNYIPVIPLSSIKLNIQSEYDVYYIAWFYATNDYATSAIGKTDAWSTSDVLNIPSGVNFVRFILSKNNGSTSVTLSPDDITEFSVSFREKTEDYIEERIRQEVSLSPFYNGSLNTNGLNAGSVNYRLRSINYIPVTPFSNVTVDIQSQYDVYYQAWFYAVNDFATAAISHTDGWTQETKLNIPSGANFVRFVFSRDNGSTSAISPSDITKAVIINGIIDASLSIAGKAADSKSVGDKIKKITDDIHPTANYIIDNLLENGSFADGEKTSSTARVRTKNFIPTNSIHITVDDSLLVHAVAWDDNGYVGYLVSDGVFSTTGTALYVSELNLGEIFSKHEGYKIALVFKKSSGLYDSTSPSDVIDNYSLTIIKDAFSEIDAINQELQVVENKVDDLSDSTNYSPIDSYEIFYVNNDECKIYNSYKAKGRNVYKGQMHCHTTQSDGAWSPTTLVNNYISAGYDFITITDHNTVTEEPTHNSGIVWLCNSYEDTKNASGGQHCNVFNTDSTHNVTSTYQTTNTPEDIIDYFVDNGSSVACYNHPEYPPVYASDATLEGLPEGFSFMEVWNGTIQCTLGEVVTVNDLPSEARYGDMYDVTAASAKYINKSRTRTSPDWQEASSSSYPEGNLDRGYRIALDNGYKVFCLAVDDCHFDSSFNYAWVNVYANHKTKEDIWNALLSGRFYASSGVTYKDISCKNGVFEVEIEPEEGETYTTYFYGENNAVLKTVTGTVAVYNITGSEKYVRAMTVSSKNLQCKAWTNPIWVISTKKQYGFDN